MKTRPHMSEKAVKEVIEEFTIPGEPLCVIEEFVPGTNTYADIDGYVRSYVVGRVIKNLRTHDIQVQSIRPKLLLRYGDIVYGKVVAILNEKVAVVKILAVQEDPKTTTPLKYPYTGLLHVSQVAEGHVPTLRDVVGIGDVVRARIISKWGPPYLISIKGANLGVIYALCPVCRVEAKKRGNKLQCPSCGMILKRKTPVVD